MPSITKTAQKKKYLVIDDEIASNIKLKEDFINDVALFDLHVEFAINCKQAITILEKDSNNIMFCVLDCRIPLNEENAKGYLPTSGENHGLSLAPKIVNINKNILIVFYSGYHESLKQAQRSNLQNVVGCVKKEESTSVLRAVVNKTISLLDLDFKDISSESTTFTYDQLDTATKQFIIEKTDHIKFLLRKTTQDIMDIGKYLIEVKEKLNHGQFYPWLENELKLNTTSAVKFMKMYTKFKSLDLNGLDIKPSALFELSYSAIPNEVLSETIDMARAGEYISVEKAKSIKNKYKNLKQESNNTEASDKITTSSSSKALKAVTPEEPSEFKHKQPESSIDQTSEPIKSQIVKVIPRREKWEIGKHTIVCSDPNSEMFKKLLPDKVALVLSFPRNKNWNFSFSSYDSINIFQTKYKDLDEKGLFSAIKNTVEITTDNNDIIVISYIPHPGILSILDTLGCRVIAAEPDYNKCLRLIEASQDLSP